MRSILRTACLCIWACGLSLGQGFGYGTAVVVLRSPKVLLAAVDSKESWREYRDGVPVLSQRTMCKVARVGPYYAIVAGLVRGTNGFDALREAAAAWRPGERLADIAERLKTSVPKLLTPLLNSLREVDPADFADRYAGNASLQITLAGTAAGKPEIVVIEFASGAARVTSCPGDCASLTTAYFLGTHEKIDEFVRQDRDYIAHTDEKHVEGLMNLEYEARPDLVGGPLSMLRVSKDGAALIRGGACPLD